MDKMFEMSLAGMNDAEKIHHLMEKVYNNMPDKSLFFCDDLEYVRTHIEKQGFAVKAEYKEKEACKEKAECGEKTERDGELVASLVVRFPMDAEDNLGRDVGIAELDKVVHLESVVVHMDYRGNGLQDKLIKYAEEEITKRGYTYVMATVSPDNKYSLVNFEKNGYRVMKSVEKYGGLKRVILLKKMIIEN